MKKRFTYQDFRDSRYSINGVIAMHIFFVLIFSLTDRYAIVHNLHAQACLITGVLFGLLQLTYQWNYAGLNYGIILLYIGICGVEFFLAGIPAEPMDPNGGNIRSFLLDLIVIMLPMVYAGLRVLLIIPLLWVQRKLYVHQG